MVVGDVMSHALRLEIVEFSLRSCLFGKWNTYKVNVIQIAKIQFEDFLGRGHCHGFTHTLGICELQILL
jgi:hypothetical protein